MQESNKVVNNTLKWSGNKSLSNLNRDNLICPLSLSVLESETSSLKSKCNGSKYSSPVKVSSNLIRIVKYSYSIDSDSEYIGVSSFTESLTSSNSNIKIFVLL